MKIIIIILAFLLPFGLFAQNPRHDRIKTLKIAFITNELNLTTKEAQVFWPIYNANEEKQDALRKKFSEIKRDLDFDSLPEEDAKQILGEINNHEKKMHFLRTKYVVDLHEALSSKKILKLLTSERDFKRQMMDEFKNRYQNRKFKNYKH